MFRRLAILFCAAVLAWIPVRALAFGVSPASLDLSGGRGEIVAGSVAVINGGTAEQTYYLGTLAFVAGEESGAPTFLPSDDQSGLAGWISFPVREVTVPARTKVDVPFMVTVPSGQASGTYQTAVTVSATPSEVVATNGATIEAKTAVLVFLTVEGETVEKLALLDFVTPGNADGPLFANHEVSYAYRLQNQGNVAVKPDATITVRDLLGRAVLVADANPSEGRVLPESTRTFTGEIQSAQDGFLHMARAQVSAFAIGPVTATLTVAYGSQTLSSSISYWAFPWQLLVCAAATVIVLVLLWNGVLRQRTKRP